MVISDAKWGDRNQEWVEIMNYASWIMNYELGDVV